MNIEVALQRYKDVFLPDVIDNSQGDFFGKTCSNAEFAFNRP